VGRLIYDPPVSIVMKINIVAATISTIDYEDLVSLVFYTQGCNFRCPFCHSGILACGTDEKEMTLEQALKEMETHDRFIDAIVVTGGEPTMLPYDQLAALFEKAKSLNLKTKIDTNGILPKVIDRLMKENLLDRVALDVKTYNNKYEYAKVSGAINVATEEVEQTMQLVKNNPRVELECRTTVVPGLVGTTGDIVKICDWIIPYADSYYVQNFRNGQTLDPAYLDVVEFTEEYIILLGEIVKDLLLDDGIINGVRM
jgi:pyruvate formate lyase activating enzyme